MAARRDFASVVLGGVGSDLAPSLIVHGGWASAASREQFLTNQVQFLMNLGEFLVNLGEFLVNSW